MKKNNDKRNVQFWQHRKNKQTPNGSRFSLQQFTEVKMHSGQQPDSG